MINNNDKTCSNSSHINGYNDGDNDDVNDVNGDLAFLAHNELGMSGSEEHD